MSFKDMSPEIQEKIKACQTPEEVLELAKEEGYELAEEELEQISGGISWSTSEYKCPNCANGMLKKQTQPDGSELYVCNSCDYKTTISE